MAFIPRCGFYIGEAYDLRQRFMEHFNGDSPCIARYAPTYFVFELIDNRTARESRYRELVRHPPTWASLQCRTSEPGEDIHRITPTR
jgi:hypothetical protein